MNTKNSPFVISQRSVAGKGLESKITTPGGESIPPAVIARTGRNTEKQLTVSYVIGGFGVHLDHDGRAQQPTVYLRGMLLTERAGGEPNGKKVRLVKQGDATAIDWVEERYPLPACPMVLRSYDLEGVFKEWVIYDHASGAVVDLLPLIGRKEHEICDEEGNTLFVVDVTAHKGQGEKERYLTVRFMRPKVGVDGEKSKRERSIPTRTDLCNLTQFASMQLRSEDGGETWRHNPPRKEEMGRATVAKVESERQVRDGGGQHQQPSRADRFRARFDRSGKDKKGAGDRNGQLPDRSNGTVIHTDAVNGSGGGGLGAIGLALRDAARRNGTSPELRAMIEGSVERTGGDTNADTEPAQAATE